MTTTLNSSTYEYQRRWFLSQCVACLKRLERGTFAWPKGTDVKDGKLRLTTTALALLLDGVDMRQGCERPWYQLG